jgi:SAM-dependent methyltransferase
MSIGLASDAVSNLSILSPKRRRIAQTDWDGFFPYYAGFPEPFARTVLSSAKLGNQAIVLDPWNGSGTTTYAASHLAIKSVGFDLNPAMIVIAKARLLAPTESDSIQPLGHEILAQALTKADSIDVANDPLTKWFAKGNAVLIRSIEQSIRRHLLGSQTLAPDAIHLDRLSPIAATNYVALFSVCRDLTRRFRSSNPTWLREPKLHEAKQSVRRRLIVQLYKAKLQAMTDALATRADLFSFDMNAPDIRLADTATATLDSASIDFILTSPPYCTRIDYAAATRIELAVLSPLLSGTPKLLARRMTGSVCVPDHEIQPSQRWGTTCLKFLEAIRNHPSKASGGYYYRTHLDYFDKMHRSLANLTNALRPGGVALLVVQDSFYKNVHNDLPTIIGDFGGSHGLTLMRQEPFYSARSMARINPYARAYSRRSGAIETVLCFQK